MEKSQDGTSDEDTIMVQVSLFYCLFGLLFVLDQALFDAMLDVSIIGVGDFQNSL